MKQYPSVKFVLRHQARLPLAGACVIAAIGFYVAWRTGFVDWAVAGLIAAAPVYCFIRLLLELVELVAEMLMPR